MDITKATMRKNDIDNNLYPELILAMMYIKNNQFTKALQNLSLYKLYTHKLSDLSHLKILGFIVYMFLHKEEQMLKSGKWAPRALKKTLVGYDGHTIYRVYLKVLKKVIQM